MTQINPGTAATLAHNTLTAQINAIIAGAAGATKSQAESLLALVDSNMQLIIDASNHQVDELNELIYELEARDSELAKSQAESKQSSAELAKLRAGRIDDEKKIRAIMDTHEQIKNQRDNYKREADEVGKVKAEIKRLKAQAERHEAAQAKKAVELSEAKQTIDRLRARLAPVADAVRGCTDLMRFVRQTLIFEGLAPEQQAYETGRATPSWEYRDYLTAKALSDALLRLQALPFKVSFVDGPKLTQHLRELTVKAVTNPKPKAALFTRSTS